MPDVVMLVGYPACGKSTYARKYLDPGYESLSRDTLGGGTLDLLGPLEEYLNAGRSVILDNTHQTADRRVPFIECAAQYDVSVKCVWINTPLEEAQINALHRMWERYGRMYFDNDSIGEVEDSNIFSISVLFAARKRFEKPTMDEGFSEIEKVKIQFERWTEHKNKALILDYDGTLRTVAEGSAHKYPITPDEVVVRPGAGEKLKQLQSDGYLLLGVSNQSGVGKGDLTEEQARACFDRTNELLGVDIEYHFCPHRIPPANCYCRKPQSGIGVYLICKHGLDPQQTIMVGDYKTDETFAKRLGFQYEDAEKFFGGT